MKYISYITISILILFSACRKDIDTVEIETMIPEPQVFIESSLRGQVVDEDGIGISNVMVEVDREMLWTDENGRFHFKSIEVKKNGSLVTAETAGYFKGSSLTTFSAEGSSYVEITIMDKGTPAAFDASEDAELTLEDDIEISIPKGTLKTINGNTYDGPVNIYSRYLDPTAENIGGIMPGALTATAENGDPLALVSYGMVAFDLETTDGLPLSIEDGESLQMKIPIPDELQSEAPMQIDLWYFDLEEEQWLLSGICESDGSHYYCNITTTGYWNCDVGIPAICLSGQVFNSDSTVASYLQVIVEDTTNNFVYWGYTDSIGYFCGSVPQAAILSISIIDHCDNELYNELIGPFAEDTQLPNIYLDQVVESYFLNISGTILHCMTNDVPNGHVAVEYPGHIRIYPFMSGGFDFDIAFLCIDFPDLKITAYSDSQQSATETFVYSDFSDIQIGQQLTCDTLTDFFNLNVDGTDYWTSPTQYSYKENTTEDWLVLEGFKWEGNYTLEIRDYQGVGVYQNNLFFKTSGNLVLPPTNPILESASPNISVNILVDDGEFIEGELFGTATEFFTGQSVPIASTFKIKKAP